MDWRRIYRRVKSIRPVSCKRELFAGVAWGVTGAGFLALVPLYQTAQPTDAWLKPTYWAVAIGSGVIGLVIWMGGNKEAENVETAKKQILDDMRDLHSSYFQNDQLETE
jgi:hypothetical protein